MKQFEGIFELFHEQPRLQVNGDKVQLVLEKPFNEKEQKELVDFFDKDVKVNMQEYAQSSQTTTTIEGYFHVTCTKPRCLANGNRTRFVLECMYDKQIHRNAVELFKKDIQIFMEIVQPELQLEDGKE